MANVARWVGGVSPGLTWTSLGATFLTNLNSLADGSCASSAQVDNSSNLDLFMDVSFSIKPGATTTATSFFSLFLLPLNEDGTTYGDGSIGVSTTFAGQPDAGFYVGSSRFGLAITTSGLCVGLVPRILMPPGAFIVVLYNKLGNALNASAAAAVKYRTFSENLNG